MAITIGIRELRQHASRYLRRVRAGETITVTDRGEPVAEIRPIKSGGSIYERLVAEGRLRPATVTLDEVLAKHPPVPMKPGDPLLSDIVIAMRDEERF
ncbi:MAG: type II toxin-antitoxin system prevent-host-death family antitoxin [Dehalococcoidia bacterium]|nr:type II toxin-antitoxin system prevent-host-death family antitoxin [Dehalococcoidia bacterium]